MKVTDMTSWHRSHRYGRWGAAPVLMVVALVVAACANGENGGADAEGIPDGPFTVYMPAGPGGGTDTNVRQQQPHLQEILDRPVEPLNFPGADGAIGQNVFLREAADCSGVLVQNVPQIVFTPLQQEAGHGPEEFAPVARYGNDPGVIMTRVDAPWNTIAELVEDARQRPGEIRASVPSFAAAGYFTLLSLEESAGIDLNIVEFGGGGPARVALLNGEVDLTHAGVFSALEEDELRVVAVVQDENPLPHLTDDAPALNDALAGLLAEPIRPDSNARHIWAHPECAANNPEGYQTIVDAYDEMLHSEAYQQELEELGFSDQFHYMSPEEINEFVESDLGPLREMAEEHIGSGD